MIEQTSPPKNGKNNHFSLEAPWFQGPSLYTHIQSHLDPVTGCLNETGISLPDEKRRYTGSQIRWAPGAMDGVFGHHGAGDGIEDIAHQVAQQVIAIAQRESDPDKLALYERLLQDNLLDFIDPAIEEVLGAGVSLQPYLHRFARWLAEHAPDRGPVKFAIALLGIIGDPKDKDINHPDAGPA